MEKKDMELVFWLVGEVGLPLAQDLYKTWTDDGKDALEEIKKLKEDGLPDWKEFRSGTAVE